MLPSFSYHVNTIHEQYEPVLAYSIAGFSIETYAVSVMLFLALTVGFRIFRTIFLQRFRDFAEKSKNDFDNEIASILEAIPAYYFHFVSLFVTLRFVFFTDDSGIAHILDGLFIGITVLEAVKVIQKMIRFVFIKVNKAHGREVDETMFNIIHVVINIAVWSTAALLFLSNLGFNISALVASLGIGGVAVALAAQNILGDIFASFSLFFDRPFKVGDFIVIGSDMGTVKRIGIKTTRLQTLEGQELVISNQELTSTRVNNYKKMRERRINFSVGVTYDTPTEKLKKIPGIITRIIEDQEHARPDRVHFASFGESSLNFEIVYYVESPEYPVYMDTQQDINLCICEAFEKEGIEMAFPTRTVYMKAEKAA